MSIIFETYQFYLLLVLQVVNEDFTMAFSAFLLAAKLGNSYHIHPVMGYRLLFFCKSSLLYIYV